MARIIYKEGCEGQNKLECIEGIEIELLNGYKALVFPKYKALPLLDEDKIESWKASTLTEFQALKVTNWDELSDELFDLGSPAAKFVRQFKSDRYGVFDLLSLLAAGEIVVQKKDIDALAEIIEGADLLRTYGPDLWSCCRNTLYGAWVAFSYYGAFGEIDLPDKLLAVPTKIYK